MAQQIVTFPMTAQSRLLTLPGEILLEIITLTMASNKPANPWLFIDVLRKTKRDVNREFPNMQPREQREHWLDWIFVNGTCRLLKCYGKSAFFREKRFVISTWCIQVLNSVVASDSVSPDLLLAKACVSNVVAPVACTTINAWQMLPALHFFDRLRCISIELPVMPVCGRFYPVFPEEASKLEQKMPFIAPTSRLTNKLKILGVHVPILTYSWRLSMKMHPSPSELLSLESFPSLALGLAVDRQGPAKLGQCYHYISPFGKLIKDG
ncbi:MAG: hypothetical protein Q9208_004991 [Pyrenodesmia sp. 3 TL-2023]